MGLDSIDLVMEVEQTFGISIPDKEAEQIFTVGDFYEVVWRHLGEKHSDKCKTQYLFYKLRTALQSHFNIPRHQIIPAVSPEAIFPKHNRRQLYHDFASAINLQLPLLILTKPWSQLLNAVGLLTIAGGLAASLILYNFFDFSGWIYLVPVAGIFLTDRFSKLLNPKRIHDWRTNIKRVYWRNAYDELC